MKLILIVEHLTHKDALNLMDTMHCEVESCKDAYINIGRILDQ